MVLEDYIGNRFSQAFTGRMSQFGSPTQTYMRSEGGGGGVGYPKGTGNSRYGGSGGGNMDGGEGGLGNRTAAIPEASTSKEMMVVMVKLTLAVAVAVLVVQVSF